MARTSNYKPLGYEWKRSDGMVMVKYAEPSKWTYKQRYVYMQHYGDIPKNHFIIFLDGNRNNYDINNLACVSSREASLIANYRLNTGNKDLTKLGLDVVKLIIATKDKQGLKLTNHKKHIK